MHDFWLTYKEIRYIFKRYVDVDGSMAKDRHTITSYAFLINGGAVYWSFKWQEIILLSTTKSEYVATTHGIKEALWLHSLFSGNQAAIMLTCDH